MGYKIKTVELEKAVKELSQLSDFEYGVIQKIWLLNLWQVNE